MPESQSTTDEIWKPIPGLAGYNASSLGRIRGITKILTPLMHTAGYLHVAVRRPNGNGFVSRTIHRLVLAAFLGESKLHVNHKNCDKHDNRLENLEYVTRSENVLHSYASGLREVSHLGNGGGMQKRISAEQVSEIRGLVHDGSLSLREIGRRFGIRHCRIRDIASGKHRVVGA